MTGVLFPLADTVLDPEAQRAVAREFETAAAEQGGLGSIEFADAAIDRLAAALGEGIQRPIRA